MFLDPLIVSFKFQNLSNSCSVYSKSREVAAVYTKQLRMNVSESTNRELKFQNLSNSCSVDSKSREVAAVYTKQLRIIDSGSTNFEFEITERFQFMFS